MIKILTKKNEENFDQKKNEEKFDQKNEQNFDHFLVKSFAHVFKNIDQKNLSKNFTKKMIDFARKKMTKIFNKKMKNILTKKIFFFSFFFDQKFCTCFQKF